MVLTVRRSINCNSDNHYGKRHRDFRARCQAFIPNRLKLNLETVSARLTMWTELIDPALAVQYLANIHRKCMANFVVYSVITTV